MSYQILAGGTDPIDQAVVEVTGLLTTGAAFQASGVLVAPNVVLTAGHVVTGAVLSSITVIPDRTAAGEPYGSSGAVGLAALPGAPADGLLTRAQSAQDLGLIALSRPLGDQTGTAALLADFGGGAVQTAGYPAASSNALSGETLATVADAETATLLYPANSVQPGSSGSPLWITEDGENEVVGVVSTAAWATRLTADDLAFVTAFEAAHPASATAEANLVSSHIVVGGDRGCTDIYQVAAPMNGVASADLSSFDLAGLLAGGYTLSVGSGTNEIRLLDGVLSLGPNTAQASVERLYLGLLGRTPDMTGLAAMQDLIDNGAGSTAIAATILASPEYAALHPAADDASFVHGLYAGLLGRDASAPEASGWEASLATGTSRAQVAADIADSAEARTNLASQTVTVWTPDANAGLVDRLYVGGLDREPGQGEAAPWQAMLQGGTSAADLAADIAGSAEFVALHALQNQNDYISGLYNTLLGRAASASDLGYWTGAIASGAASRADVLVDVARSSESVAHFTRAV